jgi:hypothetical protein
MGFGNMFFSLGLCSLIFIGGQYSLEVRAVVLEWFTSSLQVVSVDYDTMGSTYL